MNINKHIQTQRAFTLVEVMVAMVIFSVGLLGLAGLQSLGMQNNQTALFRTIAMQQAYNMSDRMRNNIAGVNAGNYDAIPTTPGVLGGINCITNTCTPAALASFDRFEWNTNNAVELPEGRGMVTRIGTEFVICIMWNELKVSAPAIPADCNGGNAGYNPTTEYKFYTLRFEL